MALQYTFEEIEDALAHADQIHKLIERQKTEDTGRIEVSINHYLPTHKTSNKVLQKELIVNILGLKQAIDGGIWGAVKLEPTFTDDTKDNITIRTQPHQIKLMARMFIYGTTLRNFVYKDDSAIVGLRDKNYKYALYFEYKVGGDINLYLKDIEEDLTNWNGEMWAIPFGNEGIPWSAWNVMIYNIDKDSYYSPKEHKKFLQKEQKIINEIKSENEEQKKNMNCCICLEDFAMKDIAYNCRTCKEGIICKGCKKNMKLGIKKCPICRTDNHKK